MIDRRRFLTRLFGASAAVIAADKTDLLYALERHGIPDPEQALWTPGTKALFIPPSADIPVVLVRNTIIQPKIHQPYSDVRVDYGDGSSEHWTGLGRDAKLIGPASAYGQRSLNQYAQFDKRNWR